VGAGALSRKSDLPALTAGSAEPDFATVVKGYRMWPRINSEPYKMPAAVIAACSDPKPGQVSPHTGVDGYIDVYVNPSGRSSMLTQGPVAFPVGSIIVKEKRHDPNASDPELLTVMLKRTKGYNPAVGDWEFAVLDGKAVAVQAQGKLENCMQCHKTVPSSDYVFRPYIPK